MFENLSNRSIGWTSFKINWNTHFWCQSQLSPKNWDVFFFLGNLHITTWGFNLPTLTDFHRPDFQISSRKDRADIICWPSLLASTKKQTSGRVMLSLNSRNITWNNLPKTKHLDIWLQYRFVACFLEMLMSFVSSCCINPATTKRWILQCSASAGAWTSSKHALSQVLMISIVI